jgi:hypothetical protein
MQPLKPVESASVAGRFVSMFYRKRIRKENILARPKMESSPRAMDRLLPAILEMMAGRAASTPWETMRTETRATAADLNETMFAIWMFEARS